MLEDVTTVTGSTDIFNGFKILYNDENHIVGVFKTSEIMQRSGWGYVHMFSILWQSSNNITTFKKLFKNFQYSECIESFQISTTQRV